MKKLENLKEIADRNLGGLKADAHLLYQIKHAAKAEPKRKIKWKPILISGTAAVALLCVALIAWPNLRGQGDIEVVSRSAGGDMPAQAIQLTAYVPAGSVSISGSKGEVPGYRTLFAAEQNGNFPLVKVGSATYRMLTSPTGIDDSLLGDELGTVTEYTLEPALSSSAIVSNVVSAQQTVYAIQGMKGALVAASVNGTMRVFQRVSFSGTAVIGSEGLKDVLLGSAQVTAMELSDVGIIDQASEAQELVNILLQYANYESAAQSANTGQSLLLALDNGLIVQMNVGNGMLNACGTWSCPEFIDAFTAAVSN